MYTIFAEKMFFIVTVIVIETSNQADEELRNSYILLEYLKLTQDIFSKSNSCPEFSGQL